MKTVFFSETGNNQRYPRDFPNARTEVAWCLALDAPMCSLNPSTKERLDNDYDLGIVIIPKNNPEKIDWTWIRSKCKKVAVMQEGPHWYFQDYQIDKQFHYYNALMESDWVYCHNKSDVNYYKGLGCKDVRVMRSLMITEDLIPRNEWGDVTIIGGNMVSWYGGFDSFIIAREIGDPIVAPSMGRKQIPCIGYEGLDTQETLHQHLSVKVGDLDKAKHLAIQLKNDDGFYQMCSNSSQEMFKKFYTEEKWLENWNEQWTK